MTFCGAGYVTWGASANLTWDPSPSTGVIGYKLYYGTTSKGYTQSLIVANTNQVTVNNLATNTTYYFAITALTSQSLESPASAEISVQVGGSTRPSLNVKKNQLSQTVVSGTGPAGYTYALEISTNLVTWTSVGPVTLDTNGAFQYVDSSAAASSRRFYRLRQTAP